jgi:hypothetical protein
MIMRRIDDFLHDRDPASIGSYPNSCSREAISLGGMAPVANRFTVKSSLVRQILYMALYMLRWALMDLYDALRHR